MISEDMAMRLIDQQNVLLNQLLYGDARKLSRWERIARYFTVRRERIVDAWLVLTGKAGIGD